MFRAEVRNIISADGSRYELKWRSLMVWFWKTDLLGHGCWGSLYGKWRCCYFLSFPSLSHFTYTLETSEVKPMQLGFNRSLLTIHFSLSCGESSRYTRGCHCIGRALCLWQEGHLANSWSKGSQSGLSGIGMVPSPEVPKLQSPEVHQNPDLQSCIGTFSHSCYLANLILHWKTGSNRSWHYWQLH